MPPTGIVEPVKDATILDTPVPEPKAAENKLYDKPDPDAATEAAAKLAADKSAADKVAADKAVADKQAADKAAADKEAADKLEKNPDGTPKKPEPKPADAKAPTDYELKLAEGSLLTADDLAATLKEAKAAGLSKEQAEAVLSTKEQTVKGVIAKQNQVFEATKKLWTEQAAKDPEYGGENYSRNIELAARAWQKLASPELQKIGRDTGIGSHPEVIRLMVKVAGLISEDRMVHGTVGSVERKKTKEEIMYGNPKSAAAPLA